MKDYYKEIEEQIDTVIRSKIDYGYLPKDFVLKERSRIILSNLVSHHSHRAVTGRLKLITYFLDGYRCREEEDIPSW